MCSVAFKRPGNTTRYIPVSCFPATLGFERTWITSLATSTDPLSAGIVQSTKPIGHRHTSESILGAIVWVVGPHRLGRPTSSSRAPANASLICAGVMCLSRRIIMQFEQFRHRFKDWREFCVTKHQHARGF